MNHAETKFPCSLDPSDEVCFIWEKDKVSIVCEYELVSLDREQVQSLRDQLTEWLEATV